MDERLLDANQAAEYLRVTYRTLAGWRHKKWGPTYYKMGGKIVYKLKELDEWVLTRAIKVSNG